MQNLQQVLRNNGFYQARIEPRLEREPRTEQVLIKFLIESGKRAEYTTPNLTGHPERPVKEVVGATGWHGWLGWKSVTESRTQDGLDRVRRWYQKRDRLMAEVGLKDMKYDAETRRVTPTLVTEAGPKVSITTAGAKVPRGKLRRMVPVYEEQSVDRDLLTEGARNLKEYFEGQGYFAARVEFKNHSRQAGQETIEYTIRRGPRIRVAVVVVQGNRYFGSDTIRERLYLRPASLLQFRHGRYSNELLRRDLAAIESLYRSNGFRDVEVTSRIQFPYQGKATDMAVFIQIREGPQWLVANLELSGPTKEHAEAIRSLLQESAGQPFSDLNVSVDRDNILDYYYNQGYPNAAFEWSFQPAAAPHRVNLRYVVQEGSAKFVREVLINGLETTDLGLVTDRVLLKPGDALSRDRMLETQRRLYDLGIFAKVDMALQNPNGDEPDKYVLLNIDESSRYAVTGGLGAEIARIGGCATCLDAPAGQAGFSPRVYFDVTRRNAFGSGHIASFRSRVSTLQKRGVLSYEAPQFRGSPNISLLFSAVYDDSRDVRTFSAKRQEGSVQLGQRLSRASQVLYRFTYRRVSVDENTLKINPQLIPLFSQPVRLGILGGNVIQDRRDDPTNAHRGIYNTLDLGLAQKSLGSQADFTRLLGRNATYHPWGIGSKYVLARSLTFGWLHQLGQDKEIPLPERFFAGGAASHRGFPENQAGPRDLLTGFPLGGKALLLSQVELRFPLLGDNVGGVLFQDAGNVYSTLSNVSFRVRQRDVTDFDYMVHAVGFGIRYRTPVGPIRVDLAYTLNPPNFVGFKGTQEQLLFGGGVRVPQQLSHFQFHFSLGQAF
jgi:outer membrane protein assembly complex protein YaeT